MFSLYATAFGTPLNLIFLSQIVFVCAHLSIIPVQEMEMQNIPVHKSN